MKYSIEELEKMVASASAGPWKWRDASYTDYGGYVHADGLVDGAGKPIFDLGEEPDEYHYGGRAGELPRDEDVILIEAAPRLAHELIEALRKIQELESELAAAKARLSVITGTTSSL